MLDMMKRAQLINAENHLITAEDTAAALKHIAKLLAKAGNWHK